MMLNLLSVMEAFPTAMKYNLKHIPSIPLMQCQCNDRKLISILSLKHCVNSSENKLEINKEAIYIMFIEQQTSHCINTKS